jgi:hypothetical protein
LLGGPHEKIIVIVENEGAQFLLPCHLFPQRKFFRKQRTGLMRFHFTAPLLMIHDNAGSINKFQYQYLSFQENIK